MLNIKSLVVSLRRWKSLQNNTWCKTDVLINSGKAELHIFFGKTSVLCESDSLGFWQFLSSQNDDIAKIEVI